MQMRNEVNMMNLIHVLFSNIATMNESMESTNICFDRAVLMDINECLLLQHMNEWQFTIIVHGKIWSPFAAM